MTATTNDLLRLEARAARRQFVQRMEELGTFPKIQKRTITAPSGDTSQIGKKKRPYPSVAAEAKKE